MEPSTGTSDGRSDGTDGGEGDGGAGSGARDFLVIRPTASFDDENESDGDEESDDEDESDDESESDEENEVKVVVPPPPPSRLARAWGRVRRCAVWAALYGFCLLVYALPLYLLPPPEDGPERPVLDELHLCTSENLDVNGNAAAPHGALLRQIFANDYWGRSMDAPNSHRSWRPLSVLSFRLLKGGRFLTDLQAHRLVNLLTHAALAQLVGLLAVRLLAPGASGSGAAWDGADPFPAYLRMLATLLFALHPTHVEATANAANRPHLLALMAGVTLSDPDLPLAAVPALLLLGFLSCETFLFQVPAVASTLFAVAYGRRFHGPHQLPRRGTLWHQIGGVLRALLARLLLLAVGAATYVGYRHSRGWLAIPTGLIRPAENPFHAMVGAERLRNYLWVVAVHVLKSWDLDPIGFSHEYGRECVRPLADWRDPRLAAPLLLGLLLVGFAADQLYRQRRRSVLGRPLLLFGVHVAWMLTLFPIAGVVRVGTFIADRIVVASTVSVCILLAYWLASWLALGSVGGKQRAPPSWKHLVLGLVLWLQWRRIHRRTREWMDPRLLLESSLRTCPRFAKAHLEVSKIYSGLYPVRLNLTKTRWHLDRVREIDPDFCDVHQQYAYLAVQENRHAEFEEALAQSLLCPFTLGASMPMWRSYWEQALAQGTPEAKAAAQARYDQYMAMINRAVQEEQERHKGD